MRKLEDETKLLRDAQVILNKEYESQKSKGELFKANAIFQIR